MKNLENNGERMDIDYYNMDYNNFDIYQKSHYKRYEFVKNFLKSEDIVGDFACGSGYGSMMMSEKCNLVIGNDLCQTTIDEVNNRYNTDKVKFEQKNILKIDYNNFLNKIVSFETIEHFDENDIEQLFSVFHNSLKNDGKLIFSTPYNQEQSENSMRFHKTFYIVEEKIKKLLYPYFEIESFFYQNYDTHEIGNSIYPKHFLIAIAKKI